MGVLSFVSELQNQKLARELAAREQQAKLDEIAARTKGTLSEQENAARLNQEAIKAEANRQWMTSAKEGIKNRSDLSVLLHAQDPNMSIAESLPAAAAAERDIKFQPQLLTSSAAKAKNAFNTGLLPTMEPLGSASGHADIMSAKAREAGGLNELNTNVERMTSAPMAAHAADVANTAQSNQMATSANAAIPGIPGVVGAQQGANVAASNLEAAKAGQQMKVIPQVSPALAAQAENAANQATIAGHGLTSASGGLITPGFGNQAAGNPMMDQNILNALIPLITSAVKNAPTNSPTAPAANALPSRQPLNLKNMGITLPME